MSLAATAGVTALLRSHSGQHRHSADVFVLRGNQPCHLVPSLSHKQFPKVLCVC